MKKYILLLALLCSFSCSRVDESEIWDKLNEHEERIEKLEAQCRQLNSNVEGIQTVLKALEQNDYVTDIVKLTEGGMEVGYSITFAKGGTINIYHGSNGSDGAAPKIGIKKASDGEYYWTSDEEWMTDDEGEMIPAAVPEDPDGEYVTPQFRVADGKWYVSYDKGNTWREIETDKVDEDLLFKSISYDGDYLYLVLHDDTPVRIPTDSLITEMQNKTSEVRLAKQYDLVVGDHFQMFYTGVVKTFNINNEGIRVVCSVGKQLGRYFEYTPTDDDAGKSYKLTITTRRFDGSIISEGETMLVVHPKLTNSTTPSNINVLIFGDSLTSSGTWAGEGLRRIFGSDASIIPETLGLTNTCTTYGNKRSVVNGFPIYHEGYGGWTWARFLQTSDSKSTTNGIIAILKEEHNYDLSAMKGTTWKDENNLMWTLDYFPDSYTIRFNRGTNNNLSQIDLTKPTTINCEELGISITPDEFKWDCANPFYNPINEIIDFKYHAQKFKNKGADVIAILLTWNGGGGVADFNHSAKIEKHINNATTLLRQAHEDFPNAKIICLGIQINSLNGGTGSSYGATGVYSDPYATAFYAFDYNKALEELITNDEFKNYCYYVDTKGQFDTEYNMPYKETDVNNRNDSETEIVGTNGVHPSTKGYYQIGDAFYRALHRVLPQIQ